MTDTREQVERLASALDRMAEGELMPSMQSFRSVCEASATLRSLLSRLEAAEAERDAAVAGAYEAAADQMADYPRAAPDETEWPHYDDQIAHSQQIIRALTPADALAALDRVKEEARRKGMEAATKIVRACAPHIEWDSTQADRMHESIIERAARHIETAMNGCAS